MDKALLERLNQEASNASAQEILRMAVEQIEGKISFATSLGAEDQLLTQMIYEEQLPIDVFTLDTGRMFQESYDVLERTMARYKINIEIMFPDAEEVKEMVAEKGINLFYESIENRKLCCGVRKIHPLQKKLNQYTAWIVGLRKEQSVTRTELGIFEWDEVNQLIKINPLSQWTEKEVWDYIKEKNIPYNTLHDQGYPSIGCAPCTRAVEEGEDIRSGRWWWEQAEYRECGLHKK